MTPGTLVLLHDPADTAAGWGPLPETLRSYGLDVVAPDVRGVEGMRYVARAALVIAATAPTAPLVLVGHGAVGPLLPSIAVAQRAAHRPVGGYVFLDARLPQARRAPQIADPAQGHGHGHGGRTAPEVPVPEDWPEAPCGYLQLSTAYDQEARQAGLRGWPVATAEQPDVAQAMHKLIVTL
ncbi:hypothetical protein ACRYCC_08545 [Actinomadura scrupuli]|uniref:hypothetical protein n=1 Tax=Actinomadura scrupuli TaxID=559629 RepID=UPI003D98D39E